MAIHEQLIEYRDGALTLEGLLVRDDSRIGPLPAVLVSHAWGGRDDFVARKAKRLAWHGYAAFCLDMYGKGVRGRNAAENSALMSPLVMDRAALARRINLAVATVRAQPGIDPARIAAMGFCFGGLCVLDLARGGADVRGVISFHGILKPNGLTNSAPVKAKVLALHGYDDPLAPPDDVTAFAREFTAAKADWQLHAYGHTQHSFTNPQATDSANGLVYNERADRRSWHTLLQFLEEALR
jgi:dienelactone hydrolase